ncbi:predicted protein [Histoplasma capsulatum var. duboisii H88]|uniref:Predicted protein n=1 Tax=Ajellomyces capsulatus (strain H88) TaxID=544711 RepID=F0U7J8_AJEC8|nr:predicted protein [Histoplasma capsulatum var. duboisii H88]
MNKHLDDDLESHGVRLSATCISSIPYPVSRLPGCRPAAGAVAADCNWSSRLHRGRRGMREKESPRTLDPCSIDSSPALGTSARRTRGAKTALAGTCPGRTTVGTVFPLAHGPCPMVQGLQGQGQQSFLTFCDLASAGFDFWNFGIWNFEF